MANKTPFEIRADLLKLAQDQANADWYAKWDQASRAAEINENAKLLTEVPDFPTTEKIITEAKKMKEFIDDYRS